MNSTHHIRIVTLIMALVVPSSYPMGNGPDETTIYPSGPKPTELEKGEPSYYATIFNGERQYEAHDLNFSGKTIIMNIRKDREGIATNIDLSGIKEIIVREPNYVNTSFSDRDYSLVDIVMIDGTKEEGFLFPRDTNVAGVVSHLTRGWHIDKITKIVINHNRPVSANLPPQTTPAEQPANDSILDKAQHMAVKAGETVVHAVKTAKEYISEKLP